MQSKRKVITAFSAPQSSSRARGSFAVGDLLILQADSGSPDHMRFVRMNGLRPNLGRELYYLIESTELHEKTEAV